MAFFVISLVKIFVVFAGLMTTLAYLQWIERKVIAHVQVRMGPSRVGPHGLMQPLADVIKLVTKEGLFPSYVNRPFYVLAPFIAVSMALISISIIPFGSEVHAFGYNTWMQITDLNVGILFILAISSLGVYGVALAGWSSNNKYSLLGGLRSSAQMISYELPLSLAITAPLLLAGTLSLREIVVSQSGFHFGFLPRWSIFNGPFPQIFSFIIFVIAGFAETNRVPFDLPEAENELVAGFHTEYSSMQFASFFMAEYANMITISSITTILFLGGWQPLFPASLGSNLVPVILFVLAGIFMILNGLNPRRKRDRLSLPAFGIVFCLIGLVFLVPGLQQFLIPFFWFAAKVGLLLFLFMWVRATLPRFRYDQLMGFAWKFLFPAALVNLLITGLAVALAS